MHAASEQMTWEVVRRLNMTLCFSRMALRLRAARFGFLELAHEICEIREIALADLVETIVADHSMRT